VTASGAIAWTLTLTGSANAAAGATTLNLSVQVASAENGSVYTASQSLPITVTLTPLLPSREPGQRAPRRNFR
jgi:hypothetical protein